MPIYFLHSMSVVIIYFSRNAEKRCSASEMSRYLITKFSNTKVKMVGFVSCLQRPGVNGIG